MLNQILLAHKNKNTKIIYDEKIFCLIEIEAFFLIQILNFKLNYYYIYSVTLYFIFNRTFFTLSININLQIFFLKLGA